MDPVELELPGGRRVLAWEDPGWPKVGDRVRVTPHPSRERIMAPHAGLTGKLVKRFPHEVYGPNGTIALDACGGSRDHALDELTAIPPSEGSDAHWGAVAAIKRILASLPGPGEAASVLSEVHDEYCKDCGSRMRWRAQEKGFDTCYCTRDD